MKIENGEGGPAEAQLGNSERGGGSHIYNRKDEIIYGLGPSVKCVVPLFRDMSKL